MTSQDQVPPPSPGPLFRLGALTAGLINRGVLLVGVLAAAVLAAFFWPDWWPALRDRFTPHFDGQIIVNSPAVFTRQRLVNDRLSQSAWLQEQLRVTTREFDSAFRSIDEVRTVRNSSSLRGQIGIGGAAGGGAAPAGTGTPTEEAKSDAAVPAIAPTSADLFRAKNTYREEVRTEIMETELDDRHDIQGNTIYRLSFEGTVLPGTRSDALAVIKVKVLHDHTQADKAQAAPQAEKGDTPPPAEPVADTPLDREYFQLYEDWLNHMQKTVQTSVTNITQTLYERAPDNRVAQALPIFLLKRICELTYSSRGNPSCDPAIYRDRDSPELKVASKNMTDFIAAYLAARRAIFQDQLRLNIITAAKKFSKTPESFLYAFDESYQFCQQAQQTQRNFYKTDWSTGYKMEVPCPVVNGPFEGVIGAIVLYNELAKALPETAQDAQAVTSRLLEAVKTRCPGEEKAICTLPDTSKESLRCLAADYMWSLLNLHDRRSEGNLKFASSQRFDRYFRVDLIGRETGMCNVVFLAKERSADDKDPVSNMRRDLNSGVEVYAYSITPKNLAQRLSTASDTRDAIQALLNANFAAGGRDVSSLIESLQKKSIQSQAIQALPIVVGYGLAPALSEEPPYTEFGWVIAPQIQIGKQDERSHTDRQYALAAVVSVPSWWRSMTLTIETCWMDRADLHKQKQLKQCDPDAGDSTRHTVRLPGVTAELSHKLGFEFVPEPRLEYRYPEDAPLKLEIGRPAQVLLTGGRIWRSTEVTLGAQRADEIAVLPNMNGILAKFRCVRRQLGDETDKPAVVPIRVWTSEGVTDPEYAQLVEPPVTDETKSKRAEMCPDELQEMKAHLPTEAVPR